MEKLSIITINRNNSVGLRKTIESVVSQTYTDFEYIIIDGASTDGSVEVIKEFADSTSRLIGTTIQRFNWISEPDTGIYNAMNKGILKAQGEYLLFLNSGDCLYNEMVIKRFIDKDVIADIVYGDVILNNGQSDFKEKKYHHFVSYDLIAGTIVHQVIFFKRIMFDRFGKFDETLRIASDWKFCVETVFKKNCSIIHYNQFISYYDSTGISSLMTQLDEQERTKVLYELFDKKIVDDYTSGELLDITRFFIFTEFIINLLFMILVCQIIVLKKEKIKYKNLPKRIQSDYIYHFKVKSILSIPYYRSFYYLVKKIAEYIIKKRQITIYY